MKPIKTLIILLLAVLTAVPAYSRKPILRPRDIKAENVDIHFADNYLVVTADLVLDSLRLKSNQQVIITPVISTLTPQNPDPSTPDPSTPQNLDPSTPRNLDTSTPRNLKTSTP